MYCQDTPLLKSFSEFVWLLHRPLSNTIYLLSNSTSVFQYSIVLPLALRGQNWKNKCKTNFYPKIVLLWRFTCKLVQWKFKVILIFIRVETSFYAQTKLSSQQWGTNVALFFIKINIVLRKNKTSSHKAM